MTGVTRAISVHRGLAVLAIQLDRGDTTVRPAISRTMSAPALLPDSRAIHVHLLDPDATDQQGPARDHCIGDGDRR